MKKGSRRWIFPVLALALLTGASVALAQSPTASTVGTLKVERHGDHGRAVILVPGLQGGPVMCQRTMEQVQKGRVV